MGDPARYILFVRHGESCANLVQDWSLTPMCTPLGVVQALEFGCRLSDNLRGRLQQFKQIAIWSSILPRAMETAQLISVTLLKTMPPGVRLAPVISRLPNIREVGSSDSTSFETVSDSSKFAGLLNNFLQPCGALPIKVEGSGLNTASDFQAFKSSQIPTFRPDTLHVIVTHGTYIQQSIYGDLGIRGEAPANLAQILVKYDRQQRGTYIPVSQKLRDVSVLPILASTIVDVFTTLPLKLVTCTYGNTTAP